MNAVSPTGESVSKLPTVAPGAQASMAQALHGKAGLAQAREMLNQQRQSGDKKLTGDGRSADPQKQKGDPSEAGRILAMQAARARAEKARQAQEAQQNQEEAGASDQRADNTSQETADLDTDDQTQSGADANAETEVSEQSEEDFDQAAIDLGGETMTRAEIKQNLLRQADYTRKTQAHAESVKAFEADRSQRLQIVDTLLGHLQAQVGQPKDLADFLAEDPIDGLQKFAQQQRLLGQLNNAYTLRAQEQGQHVSQLKSQTIKALADTQGDKAQAYFDDAVNYAHSRLGGEKANMEAILSHPEAVSLIHDAKAYRALQASQGNVKKLVASKPAVFKPGTKVSAQASAQSKVHHATAALKASGKLSDAVALLRAKRPV